MISAKSPALLDMCLSPVVAAHCSGHRALTDWHLTDDKRERREPGRSGAFTVCLRNGKRVSIKHFQPVSHELSLSSHWSHCAVYHNYVFLFCVVLHFINNNNTCIQFPWPQKGYSRCFSDVLTSINDMGVIINMVKLYKYKSWMRVCFMETVSNIR